MPKRSLRSQRVATQDLTLLAARLAVSGAQKKNWMVVDRGAVERRLDAYDRAWRSPGTALLAGLFAPDASCLVEPWAGPGPAATPWEGERDGPDERFCLSGDSWRWRARWRWYASRCGVPTNARRSTGT